LSGTIMHMSEHSKSSEQPPDEESVAAPQTDQAQSEGKFVLRDCRYGTGGGVPGVDPDDWMSIKHLVRGAGG
jgi:hypothetical protein